MKKRWLKILISLFLFLYIGWVLVSIFGHEERLQWDLLVYYYATRAFNDDQDIYDRDTWIDDLHQPRDHAYLYPPVTVLLFEPLCLLEYETAHRVFLIIKLMVLVFLFVLWQRKILNRDPNFYFILFFLFAYNATIMRDIFAGNIEIFLQFGIWSGFYFLMKRQYLLFGAILAVVATFKLTPLFFLGILLFTDEPKRYLYFLYSIGVFAAIMLGIFVLYPQHFISFLGVLDNVVYQRGIINPSSYAFIDDLLKLIGSRGLSFANTIQSVVFLVFVAYVFSLTWRYANIVKRKIVKNKDMLLISLFCFAYALAIPRFKDYQFILLIPPSYFLIRRLGKYYVPFFLILVLSPVPAFRLPHFELPLELIDNYFPFLSALLLGGFLLKYIKSIESESVVPESMDSH